jgi:hypothetical protein
MVPRQKPDAHAATPRDLYVGAAKSAPQLTQNPTKT